jgi:NAD(P)-dependent dehydrogenase (short-subunit alcohol dehydrogenase family)
MKRAKSVQGKRALITGAARGIGLATAQRLGAAGATIVLADIDEELLGEAAERLKAAGATPQTIGLDVRDEAAFGEAVARIESETGPVDILVNNAGIMALGGFLEQELASDHRQIDVNLYGVIHGSRAVLPYMIQRQSGNIVNIASVAGIVGTPNAAVYSASKFGVIGLTQALHMEFGGAGIGFAYVCPALVRTELIAGAGEPLWPKPVMPEAVAETVYQAIVQGRVDNFVPKAGRLSVLLPALLPRRVYEKIGAFLGLNGVFIHIDSGERAHYRRRIRSK